MYASYPCFLSCSVAILVTILYWLNALNISSEPPKCVGVALRKENFGAFPSWINLVESEPKFEFSTFLPVTSISL